MAWQVTDEVQQDLLDCLQHGDVLHGDDRQEPGRHVYSGTQ